MTCQPGNTYWLYMCAATFTFTWKLMSHNSLCNVPRMYLNFFFDVWRQKRRYIKFQLRSYCVELTEGIIVRWTRLSRFLIICVSLLPSTQHAMFEITALFNHPFPNPTLCEGLGKAVQVFLGNAHQHYIILLCVILLAITHRLSDNLYHWRCSLFGIKTF